MSKRIAIIGHGVVGQGMEHLFKDKFEGMWYDIAPLKTETENQRLREEANTCDLAVVCVPTNETEDGSADTSIVEESVAWLETPLILIKSTIPPGTTDRLKKKYGKRICFSPEYLGESSYYTPFWKYPDPLDSKSHTFTIVGGDKEDATEIMNYFMKVQSVDTHYVLTTAILAELTKYMENTFFSTKVTFCNEWFEIAKAFGADFKELRELWLLDPRINPMHTVVFPDDRGFGGKCFPKDTAGIVSASEGAGYEPKLLKQVLSSNKEFRGRNI